MVKDNDDLTLDSNKGIQWYDKKRLKKIKRLIKILEKKEEEVPKDQKLYKKVEGLKIIYDNLFNFYHTLDSRLVKDLQKRLPKLDIESINNREKNVVGLIKQFEEIHSKLADNQKIHEWLNNLAEKDEMIDYLANKNKKRNDSKLFIYRDTNVAKKGNRGYDFVKDLSKLNFINLITLPGVRKEVNDLKQFFKDKDVKNISLEEIDKILKENKVYELNDDIKDVFLRFPGVKPLPNYIKKWYNKLLRFIMVCWSEDNSVTSVFDKVNDETNMPSVINKNSKSFLKKIKKNINNDKGYNLLMDIFLCTLIIFLNLSCKNKHLLISNDKDIEPIYNLLYDFFIPKYIALSLLHNKKKEIQGFVKNKRIKLNHLTFIVKKLIQFNLDTESIPNFSILLSYSPHKNEFIVKKITYPLRQYLLGNPEVLVPKTKTLLELLKKFFEILGDKPIENIDFNDESVEKALKKVFDDLTGN